MLDNPFTVLERRLDRLESHLLEIKRSSQPPTPKPDRCTFDEALEITGLSKSKLYKLTSSDEIPHKRYGNRLIFSRRELTAWVEEQTVEKNSDDATQALAASARRKQRRG